MTARHNGSLIDSLQLAYHAKQLTWVTEMYFVDGRGRVIELEDVPQSSVGAPLPIFLDDEGKILLSYIVQDTPSDGDGSFVRDVEQARLTNDWRS